MSHVVDRVLARETRFGAQPLYLLLRDRGRGSITELARELRVPERHLFNVLYGWTRPNDILRRRLPDLLGLPLTELFTAEALAEPFATRPKRKDSAS